MDFKLLGYLPFLFKLFTFLCIFISGKHSQLVLVNLLIYFEETMHVFTHSLVSLRLAAWPFLSPLDVQVFVLPPVVYEHHHCSFLPFFSLRVAVFSLSRCSGAILSVNFYLLLKSFTFPMRFLRSNSFRAVLSSKKRFSGKHHYLLQCPIQPNCLWLPNRSEPMRNPRRLMNPHRVSPLRRLSRQSRLPKFCVRRIREKRKSRNTEEDSSWCIFTFSFWLRTMQERRRWEP